MNTIDIVQHESAVALNTRRRDRIFVRDYVVDVEVGAFQEERGATQALKFFVAADLADTIHVDDDVDSIVSYDSLISAIEISLSAGRADLLETLAERIATHVLTTAAVAETTVRIEKLDRISGSLGVEIVRVRTDVAQPAARKRVNFTVEIAGEESGSTVSAPGSCACVFIATASSKESWTSSVNWAGLNADLLSLDIAAWRLADQMRDVPVVASRTELEWALEQEKSVIWAPSRMILNAAAQDRPATLHPEVLAAWISRQLDGNTGVTPAVGLADTKSGASGQPALAD